MCVKGRVGKVVTSASSLSPSVCPSFPRKRLAFLLISISQRISSNNSKCCNPLGFPAAPRSSPGWAQEFKRVPKVIQNRTENLSKPMLENAMQNAFETYVHTFAQATTHTHLRKNKRITRPTARECPTVTLPTHGVPLSPRQIQNITNQPTNKQTYRHRNAKNNGHAQTLGTMQNNL